MSSACEIIQNSERSISLVAADRWVERRSARKIRQGGNCQAAGISYRGRAGDWLTVFRLAYYQKSRFKLG